MNGKLLFSLLVGLTLIACGGSSVPTPFVTGQDYTVSHTCTTDFSGEEGNCLSLVDGQVTPFCDEQSDDCVEQIYVKKKRGLPTVVHVNAPYPCYPQWIFDQYNDPDSEYYKDSDYRVTSIELATFVVKETVNLIEVFIDRDLQTSETCYYRFESSIDDLTDGEYLLKLWDAEESLLLQTKFTK